VEGRLTDGGGHRRWDRWCSDTVDGTDGKGLVRQMVEGRSTVGGGIDGTDT
jgi:hypothetical protein